MPYSNEIMLNKKSEFDMKLFTNSTNNITGVITSDNEGKEAEIPKNESKKGIKSIKEATHKTNSAKKDKMAESKQQKSNQIQEIQTRKKFKDVKDLKDAIMEMIRFHHS